MRTTINLSVVQLQLVLLALAAWAAAAPWHWGGDLPSMGVPGLKSGGTK